MGIEQAVGLGNTLVLLGLVYSMGVLLYVAFCKVSKKREFMLMVSLVVNCILIMLIAITWERGMLNLYDMDKVGVSQQGRYTEVTVPKGDEGVVTSLEYTVNELIDIYGEDYKPDRYLSKEDVTKIKLDTTGYKVVD